MEAVDELPLGTGTPGGAAASIGGNNNRDAMATLNDDIVADLKKGLSGVVANTVTCRFGQIEQKFVRMFEEHNRGVNDGPQVHALQTRELTQQVDALSAAAKSNNTAVGKLGRSLAEA